MVVWKDQPNTQGVFGKSYQKVHFEKAECLASTYKSGGLSGKLPKRTVYM